MGFSTIISEILDKNQAEFNLINVNNLLLTMNNYQEGTSNTEEIL